ncbi:MAG: hypothetical protein F6K54_29880 [Okeania sp. SIO3B5]|uniref:hypothetical protein n=1 Tax=Okeania sp. SIO3B5 TaxID=2607811 RepID=UPI0013FF3AA3|nr:hypothetical protein [Okeania sp. SIO3B5]NEO56914.1 hypothetical protein [Okeania sp. SIO3B5]
MNIQAKNFLKKLGYTESDRLYFRGIKNRRAYKADYMLGEEWGELIEWEKNQRNVYVVVNGGGYEDKEVAQGRAIFYEHDNISKDEQLDLWKKLCLPQPTIQVDTGGKSIHNYWVFSQPIEIEQWKELQAHLLEFSQADRKNKNPARLMRLPGFAHPESDAKATIISQSEKVYSYEELRQIVPVPTLKNKVPALGNQNHHYKPEGILFPSRLFQHYKNPLALWLYARHLDKEGSGQAIFSLQSAAKSLNFSVQTLKGWLCQGKKSGLWRYYDTSQILGSGTWVKLFYTSSHRLAADAGLTDFGPVAEISLDDFCNHRLTILATEIELQELQKQSKFAAHCEAIAAIQEKLLIKKVSKAKKLAPKPLLPEEIIPATKMARVLWRSGCKLGVSEGFLSYGASQQGVADRRGVCTKTVQRHLSNYYRCTGSPIRDFRKCSSVNYIALR